MATDDLADLDTEPDIPGDEAIAEKGDETPLPGDEEIDIRFADAVDDEKANDTSGTEREPARGHLQREQRLKREARARADALDAEVQRLQSENAALRAKSESAAGGPDDVDKELEAKTKEFQKVRAEFDPEKSGEEARLIREIAALEYRKQRKVDGPGNGAEPTQSPPRVNPKVQEWMDKNDWFNNPDYEKETRRARSIDAALYADGYRVEDEDYFDELDRRLDKANVRRAKRPANGEGQGARANGDSPVVGGRVDAPTGGRRSVTLTREDLTFMATCGLDPKNKAHLREFAMNKLQEARKT